MDYKEACAVFLFDEGIQLLQRSYPDGIVGWKMFAETTGKTLLCGESLSALLQVVGIPESCFVQDSYSEKKDAKIRRSYNIEDHDLPLLIRSMSEPDQFNVHRILARVDGPTLDLTVLISSDYGDMDGSKKTGYRFVSVTYSGKFSVWWREDADDFLICDQGDDKYPEKQLEENMKIMLDKLRYRG